MPILFPSNPVLTLPLQIILIFFAAKICSWQDLIFLKCSKNSYDSQSSYDASLHRLFTSLIASVPVSSNFYLSDSAKINSQSSSIFALAQCRPDLPGLCADCLNKTASLATASRENGGCERSIAVAARLGECLLLYSDQPNLAFPEWDDIFNLMGSNVSASEAFSQRVNILVSQAARDALKASSRFAVTAGFGEGPGGKNIYVMVWCRLDPFSNNCMDCLHSATDELIMNRFGGLVAKIGCFVRFEIFPFFSLTEIPSPPEPKVVFGSEGNMTTSSDEGKSTKFNRIIILSISEAVTFVLVCIIFILIWLRRKKKITIYPNKDGVSREHISIDHFVHHELGNIRVATSDFSEENKLGEGGFGAVYKGVLRDGKEIAVKRLSKTSVQGVVELKNEVAFVAKLQHRNLVRLLGCCLEKEEKLLVYEFLPNKSLDKFLFDPVRRAQLDWGTRYKIIEGVAQGLLYLHEDSRLRVIHCDLKASNILLDCSMNPKISDFGFAKLFGLNEAQTKTSQIAGTQGYMAPEYAMRGLFSTKSDVYSYGILMLEMVTGRRSVCLDESTDPVDLQTYVAENWKQAQALQAVDPSLGDRYMPEQVLRCIQIGLLCIQEDPAQRPSMASLVVMLSTNNVLLPEPLLPAFLR